MKESNFKNNKTKNLFLIIESFFYNEISLDWSLSILYIKILEYIKSFVSLETSQLFRGLDLYGEKYLFAFFGLSNYYLREIDNHIMIYNKMHDVKKQIKQDFLFRDFQKWSNLVANFEQTQASKDIIKNFIKDIASLKKVSCLDELESSFYLKSFFDVGKKIYGIDNTHRLWKEIKANNLTNKIISIDDDHIWIKINSKKKSKKLKS